MAYGMIAFAAFLWGMLAFFVKGLSHAGFDAMDIVTIRAGMATVMLMIIGLMFYRNHLKIQLKDVPLFIGTGLLSIVFFNWCYFTAIEAMNIPVAVSLLYTSPAFVIMLSAFFLKEQVTRKKMIAVIGTVIGAAMIAGLSLDHGSLFPLSSIFIGLGAGLGYALYSIFGKIALRKYHPFTLTLYTFIVAAVCLIPSFIYTNVGVNRIESTTFLYAAGLGLIPTVLAYFAYSWGLEKVESSKAAIIATVEPVAACFLGYFVYSEQITMMQFWGIVFILTSVVFVNVNKGNIHFEKNKRQKNAPL